MVEMEVRIDDVRDVAGLQAEQAELRDDALARAAEEPEVRRQVLAEVRDGIAKPVGVDAGIEQHLALRVHDQERRHRDAHRHAFRRIRKERTPVEFERAAIERVDLYGHAGTAGTSSGRASLLPGQSEACTRAYCGG